MIDVEVTFVQQDAVSVFLESALVGEEEQRAEILLFSFFATRNIANLGRRDTVGSSLGDALCRVHDDKSVYRLLREFGGTDLRLVDPRKESGPKRFNATLRLTRRGPIFKLKAHGVGVLGKGLGFYSPTATLALLAYLLQRRQGDRRYNNRLVAAANAVGRAADAVSLRSQARVAMEAAAFGWQHAFAEPE